MDEHLATAFARIATARQDWSEAACRWNNAYSLNPHSETIAKARGNAFWHLQLVTEETDGGGSASPRNPVAIEKVQDPVSRDLVLGFESLGENCEFGLVQRRFEAEPLGLLRWTYTGPDMLARLLESKFAALGDVEKLGLSKAHWGEYFLKDLEYGVTFHTFLQSFGGDKAIFLRKQAARLRWLRDKMLADLTEGDKIFIYKIHHPASDRQIERVFSAIRSYGRSRLLCVGVATEGDCVGTVNSLDGSLLRGYLSRVEPSGDLWNIPFDQWLSICRNARLAVVQTG